MFLSVVTSTSKPAASAALSNSLLRNRSVFRRLIKAAGGKLDNSFDLFTVQPFELIHDVVDTGSRFEILEYGGYRHPGSLENPCAADFAGNALDGRAL